MPDTIFHALTLLLRFAPTDGVSDWLTHLPAIMRPAWTVIAERMHVR